MSQLLILPVEHLWDACLVGLRREQQIPQVAHKGARVLLEEAGERELHLLGIERLGFELTLHIALEDVVLNAEVLFELLLDPWPDHLELHLGHVDAGVERIGELGRLEQLLVLD